VGQARRRPEGQLVQARLGDLRLAKAGVAETEDEILSVRVELREQPGGCSIRGEDLNDSSKAMALGETKARHMLTRTVRER